MPYKCVHCDKVYSDGSPEIIKGCNNGQCHSKFFFYIKPEKLNQIQAKTELENIETVEEIKEIESPDLTLSEKKQVEQDVREILGTEDEESPVFLDFESIRVLKPGKYLLNLARLFERDRPQVYQLEDGKYVVDLSSSKTYGFKDK